jgi:hypothetical protein
MIDKFYKVMPMKELIIKNIFLRPQLRITR